MSDYYPDVTPDPNFAAVLRDRDVWKQRARDLEDTIERYLEAVTSNAPDDERTAAWDALVLTVW